MKHLLRRKFDEAFARLLPANHVRLGEGFRARLQRDPVTVADVGAVFGPDPRWLQLGEGTCRFLTFEPDKRSQEEAGPDSSFEMLALPTALGSEVGRKVLYLTAGEFASSLYMPNAAVLSPFCTWPWHELVGQDELGIDTLDNVVMQHSGWAPDFIKTDVEGADLDVLHGGQGALAGALGVQVEVAFVERNLGAPLFAEIDQFLRVRGLMLFQLLREHWLRSNGVIGPASRPQVIWADVIYMRDAGEFATRLSDCKDEAARAALLAKFTAILLVHGHHDYALDVMSAARIKGHCSEALAAELREAILASARQPRAFVLRGMLALMLAGIVRLTAWPFGASARRQSRELYRSLARRLYYHLYRENARTGLQDGCISDLP